VASVSGASTSISDRRRELDLKLYKYLPFTAGAQLYAVTTEGEPLDPGVGAALFLTWTALVIVVGSLLFQRRDVG
jgi:hypothetical protein